MANPLDAVADHSVATGIYLYAALVLLNATANPLSIEAVFFSAMANPLATEVVFFIAEANPLSSEGDI